MHKQPAPRTAGLLNRDSGKSERDKKIRRAGTRQRGENLLWTQTAFICDPKFENEIPELENDCYHFLRKYPPKTLSRFFLTDLDKQLDREATIAGLRPNTPLLLPVHTDPHRQLDESDAAILMGADGETVLPSLRTKRRLQSYGSDTKWVKTTYMTGVASSGRRLKPNLGGTNVGRGSGDGGKLVDASTFTQQVEDTFDKAQQPIPPNGNPNIHPVQILPVVPDMVYASTQHWLVKFDSDPVLDNDDDRQQTQQKRHWIEEHSVLKRLGDQEEAAHAYLTPLHVSNDQDEGVQPVLYGEYTWNSEYDVQQQAASDTRQYHVLVMRPDQSVVTFVTLGGMLRAQKRRASSGKQGGAQPKKQRTFIRQRDQTDEEREAAVRRVRTLTRGKEDGCEEQYKEQAAVYREGFEYLATGQETLVEPEVVQSGAGGAGEQGGVEEEGGATQGGLEDEVGEGQAGGEEGGQAGYKDMFGSSSEDEGG